jgi:hypothetical protein
MHATCSLGVKRQAVCLYQREGRMKITDVKTIFVDRYLFVQVYTDEGIVGAR